MTPRACEFCGGSGKALAAGDRVVVVDSVWPNCIGKIGTVMTTDDGVTATLQLDGTVQPIRTAIGGLRQAGYQYKTTPCRTCKAEFEPLLPTIRAECAYQGMHALKKLGGQDELAALREVALAAAAVTENYPEHSEDCACKEWGRLREAFNRLAAATKELK